MDNYESTAGCTIGEFRLFVGVLIAVGVVCAIGISIFLFSTFPWN